MFLIFWFFFFSFLSYHLTLLVSFCWRKVCYRVRMLLNRTCWERRRKEDGHSPAWVSRLSPSWSCVSLVHYWRGFKKGPFVFGMFNKSLTVVMSLEPNGHCRWPGSGAPAFMEFMKAIATVQEALLGSCETWFRGKRICGIQIWGVTLRSSTLNACPDDHQSPGGSTEWNPVPHRRWLFHTCLGSHCHY